MSDLSDQLQPLMSHLIELRTRLVRGMLVFIVGFLIAFAYSAKLYDLLAAPLVSVLPGQKLVTIGIASPFLVQVKIAAMVAFVATLPHTLYQLWAFVAPGLYTHEKKLVLPLIVASSLLFVIGMAFAYFLVFGVVFHFIASVVPASMQWLPDSSEYLDFVIRMFIAFGVTFEVPVAVILLVKTGLVSVQKLRQMRPYMIVGAFVIAAVVTPPDVLSQCLLAVPLWLLYELGVLASAWIIKPKQQA